MDVTTGCVQSCAGSGWSVGSYGSSQGGHFQAGVSLPGPGGPSVPHLPTGHLISHEPRQEPLVQAGLCQPSSFHQLYMFWVHGNRAVVVECCSSLLILSHFLVVGLANEAPGPGSDLEYQQLHLLHPSLMPVPPPLTQDLGSGGW